ncbi:MAG: DUF3427 domain-containing protein [Pseudohongiellaceae bacterium]
MNSNINYYNEQASAYVSKTAEAETAALRQRFVRAISNRTRTRTRTRILDAGCGSGRDSLAFLREGYSVTAFDASHAMAEYATELIGQPVSVHSFEDIKVVHEYDGIWACASLLHVPASRMTVVLRTLWAALKPGGAFYCSYKLGDGERFDGERNFTDANEERLQEWAEALDGVANIDIWRTGDELGREGTTWINCIMTKQERKLVSGGRNDPFLPHLCAAIHQANEIEIAVSFIKATGLRLLMPDLLDALHWLERSGEAVPVRVLTSDYLDVTDPQALRLLMLLSEHGADVRIFESKGESFHLKAYIFAGRHDDKEWGSAFIGSSNISQQALQHGLEWNYRVDHPGDSGFLESRAQFNQLFNHPKSRILTDAWIEEYEQRRTVPEQAVAPGSTEVEPPPEPTKVQTEALKALNSTRANGYARGLVVLATGLGKTWLSAFDTKQMGARRVLFVAHREEILDQAAETFARIRPTARIGFYRGSQRDAQVDVLCASVQTLGKAEHLQRFPPQHFDYVVVDEFHHAAASTYHRVLQHFAPAFLLGLTATPDRTDNANILSLCDDNLVYESNLFSGVQEQLLVPFHYFGIFDEDVDYQSIPWRHGQFDPDILANKLATISRARHALATWRLRKQQRTLAFCVSIKHADFMAEYFRQQGVRAAAVHGSSVLSRGEALTQLSEGQLDILFSVDLFNEGVDLPAIDTVMMLRPTESKILFLQQLGRGLRKAPEKAKLVVLDFVANHQSFLHKPMALMNQSMNHRELAEFAKKAEQGALELPEGCYVNYDLQFIEFLKSLDSGSVAADYESLREVFGRRPTVTEFYRSGASLQDMRRQYDHWFGLVVTEDRESLTETEAALIDKHREFLREVETTRLTKSFKLVLLEAFQELDGWHNAPTVESVANRSWQILQRRRQFQGDLPEAYQARAELPDDWLSYWKKNPVNAWAGGQYFSLDGELLVPAVVIQDHQIETFSHLVQELIDYRYAGYSARVGTDVAPDNVVALSSKAKGMELPYFPNLAIACGHFKTGRTDAEQYRVLPEEYGQVDANRYFIARASGNSMNGGRSPIVDGDYLLLEVIDADHAGKITGEVIAIERQEAGDNQYLLRKILKDSDGTYRLRANNPDYEDIVVTDELQSQFRTFARLRGVIDPLAMHIGQRLLREEIPGLFGASFNPGNWHSGHVALSDPKAHILLVTINKQGRAADLRYHDHWIDERHFHWQSQNSTAPTGKRGREIIKHDELGIDIHLFVRENKLENGKAAPFTYHGKVRYVKHEGSKPMSVTFELLQR